VCKGSNRLLSRSHPATGTKYAAAERLMWDTSVLSDQKLPLKLDTARDDNTSRKRARLVALLAAGLHEFMNPLLAKAFEWLPVTIFIVSYFIPCSLFAPVRYTDLHFPSVRDHRGALGSSTTIPSAFDNMGRRNLDRKHGAKKRVSVRHWLPNRFDTTP
jgi:hypothetical protein